MDAYGQVPRQDLDTGLEESMWRLGLAGGSGGGADFSYPERPGVPDCAYYMRTGACGYGERCRFNHPRDRGIAQFAGAGEYPERAGQPVCEYYMKTGTCKFGSSCKYHHPRHEGGSARPVLLNYYGYPLRPGERECSYYMKTGQCKFGPTCKFDHPQPANASMPSSASIYFSAVQPSSISSSQQYPSSGSWQVGRPSAMLSGAYVPSSYGPMVLSPGVVPVPGWGAYPSPLSPGAQQTAQVGSLYGPPTQLSPSAPAYARPSIGSQRESTLPERPGQPECQFYMRTGDCKFGASCKYHHPRDWSMPMTNCMLSRLGLPLRPGAQICAYYSRHGVCKFGPTCKFDHPVRTLSYGPLPPPVEMPAAPYPIEISLPTIIASSSSTQISAASSSRTKREMPSST
ncbi:Zinc finger CCCH domain-containing protein 32 [Apostasia shenzhenica]|uniref:Zinc finger CCCH domain-containing protein 32 n=1 Tax=Apostasia shenzhenica TaxID=1088818 RepID=A0A2I0ASD5_9ASPA|nr:Zinc finger CCCH domain-containing protein 32 [Apostasia shenzhenica]